MRLVQAQFGGVRKVIKISEIIGMEGDVMSMHDIFALKQTGLDNERRAQGYFFASGIRPNSLERLETSGVALPVEMFERRLLNV